jgi:hypothetical protein
MLYNTRIKHIQEQLMNYDVWEYDCEFLRKYEAYAITRYHKVVNRVFGTLIAIFSVLYMFVACPAPLEVMLVSLSKVTILGVIAGTRGTCYSDDSLRVVSLGI